MSKQQKENELDARKKRSSLGSAKDNPETDYYENPIKKPVQIPEDDKANEDPT